MLNSSLHWSLIKSFYGHERGLFMAVNKVKPRAGALLTAIENKALTQQDFAKKVGCSRTTLQDINKGKEIKSDTLRKIADELRIPMEHLLELKEPSEADDAQDQIVMYDFKDFGRDISLRLPRIKSAEDLKKILQHTNTLIWSLNIKDITDEIEEALIEFERRVEELKNKEKYLPFDEGVSLSQLIENRKSQFKIEDYMKNLGNKNIYIYGASYIDWKKEVNYEVIDPYGDYPEKVIDYTSTKKGIIILDNQNLAFMRYSTLINAEPPLFTSAGENRIRVDGDWLDDQPKEDSLNEVNEEDYLDYL